MRSPREGPIIEWSPEPTSPDVLVVGEDTSGSPAPVRRPWALVALCVAVLLLTAAVFYRWGSSSGAAPLATASVRPSPSASKEPTTAAIYDTVAPSVVTIEGLGADGKPLDSGTGVIVNGDGTIMTALHVVKDATALRLTFADGTTSTATVIAADPKTDIATLAPDTLPSTVVPAVLGNPSRLAVGDSVIAIGNPLGLTRTTTTGVVSGLDRPAAEEGGVNLTGLIQFDAAVNPGSSGGPLLNSKGEIVGIVVALANPTSAGTFIGIGFAVPITAAAAGPGGSRGPQQ